MKWWIIGVVLVLFLVLAVRWGASRFLPRVQLAQSISSVVSTVRGRLGGNGADENASPSAWGPDPKTTISPTPGPLRRGDDTGDSRQTYRGRGFSLKYPEKWGLLTCSNSTNFEFDPANNRDQAGVVCNWAVKPITAMARTSDADCRGNSNTLGGTAGRKRGEKEGTYTYYTWCTTSPPFLEFSHRVGSTQQLPGTATNASYEREIEEIIGSIQKDL